MLFLLKVCFLWTSAVCTRTTGCEDRGPRPALASPFLVSLVLSDVAAESQQHSQPCYPAVIQGPSCGLRPRSPAR